VEDPFERLRKAIPGGELFELDDLSTVSPKSVPLQHFADQVLDVPEEVFLGGSHQQVGAPVLLQVGRDGVQRVPHRQDELALGEDRRAGRTEPAEIHLAFISELVFCKVRLTPVELQHVHRVAPIW